MIRHKLITKLTDRDLLQLDWDVLLGLCPEGYQGATDYDVLNCAWDRLYDAYDMYGTITLLIVWITNWRLVV